MMKVNSVKLMEAQRMRVAKEPKNLSVGQLVDGDYGGGGEDDEPLNNNKLFVKREQVGDGGEFI